MPKRTKAIIATILLVLILWPSAAFTQTYSRTITAWFNNLAVSIDGETLYLENEPFIFNNVVYMPVEELLDRLYMNYEYDSTAGQIQIQSNRLNVTDPGSSAAPIAFQKNLQLTQLQKRVADLETELNMLRSGNFAYQKISSITEMQAYIQKHFETLGEIPMTLSFYTVGTNQYRLNATFASKHLTEWNNLSRRDIELWVDDIFYTIRELFNSDAAIQGNIQLATTDDTFYASYWTRNNRLFFDFALATHKESLYVDGNRVETTLNQRLKNYNNAVFTYEVFVNQYDIDILAYYDDYVDEWSPQLKMQYLTRIRTEVERLYNNASISGRVIERGKTDPLLRFSFDGDLVLSADLMNDIQNRLNEQYKNFYHGSVYTFTYRLSAGTNGTMDLILEGNFSKSDPEWIKIQELHGESVRSFIQNACRYVEGFWKMDIFGEVVDRNGQIITDFQFMPQNHGATRMVQPLTFY